MPTYYLMHLDGKRGVHLVPKEAADDSRTQAVSLCGKTPKATNGAQWVLVTGSNAGRVCRLCENVKSNLEDERT